ncbi:hypothetical protein N665_1271s0001 [Sinapis alba]|nr:hypothetical protein N665_1271s0001 [Sinapis alba]
MGEAEENEAESNERLLALSPTWSGAIVLSVFVLVSLIVERSIHRLSTWLRNIKRKTLFAALEKMIQGSLPPIYHQENQGSAVTTYSHWHSYRNKFL